MYVTRPRSLYTSSPGSIFEPPPEGPNSGILVIDQAKQTIKAPPLPQNKILSATYSHGDSTATSHVLFISVLSHPLSSNLYYMISAEGGNQGLAYECSTEDDMETHCCCNVIPERKPTRLNPLNIYQQFQISFKNNHCEGKSVAHDGVVKNFLEQSCRIYPSSSAKYERLELTEEALGLNATLRNNLPSFDFPLIREGTPPVEVGKWVCPFMFVREGRPKVRMKNSPFYSMALEQRWERVFTCENTGGGSSVVVDVRVKTEDVKMNGKDAELERDGNDGVLWVWGTDDLMEDVRVGLGLVIVERMEWEVGRVGWVKGNEKEVLVRRRFESLSEIWRRFGCYVLVERFVLRRMDGSLVLTYEFRHTQLMRSKWE